MMDADAARPCPPTHAQLAKSLAGTDSPWERVQRLAQLIVSLPEYIVGDTIYQLIVEFPRRMERELEGDVEKFFSSLELP